MNKKGITLVELLAAIVIFGMVSALVASILTTVLKANKEIQISSLANSEGNYLITLIENELQTFELTSSVLTYTSTSIELFSDQRNVLNASNIIVNDSTDQTITINLDLINNSFYLIRIENSIQVKNINYQVNYFTLGSNSGITYTVYNNKLRVQITFDFIDEYGKSHIYLASHIFNLP